MFNNNFQTASVEETFELAKKFTSFLRAGDVVALNGDLGSGKTEFVRGIVSFFSEDIIVRSPSFALVNTYVVGTLNIHHFDFYRLNDYSELFEIGFDEYINDDAGIVLIEWADMFEEVLEFISYSVDFIDADGDDRTIVVSKIG